MYEGHPISNAKSSAMSSLSDISLDQLLIKHLDYLLF